MKSSRFRHVLVLLVIPGLLAAGCSGDEPAVSDAEEAVAAQRPDVPVEAVPAPSGVAAGPALPVEELPEIIVVQGLEQGIEWLKKEGWWGEEQRGEQLSVPRLIVTAIHPAWQEASRDLPVRQKKEVFYRLMLPLVMHANEMVKGFRNALLRMSRDHAANGRISGDDLPTLKRLAMLLPGATLENSETLTVDHPEMANMLDALLYRVDEVPAGLALGQAAYESGYGTSRFAVEGNSLFGQWTYQGDGIVPQEQRRSTKGDHRIKAFDWPFDSVRGYFINLMSHPAYEDFRRLRAESRAAGEPLVSMTLADGLLRYSERGQEYVDDLKGIMRVNHLDRADNAVFRDEPMRFLLSEQTAVDVERMQAEIEAMRQSGELAEIIERMRLD